MCAFVCVCVCVCVRVCFYKVWPCYMILFESYWLFITGHSHCHAPFLPVAPEQLISCPLTHDQPFHLILCKSVHPLGSYAPILYATRLCRSASSFSLSTRPSSLIHYWYSALPPTTEKRWFQTSWDYFPIHCMDLQGCCLESSKKSTLLQNQRRSTDNGLKQTLSLDKTLSWNLI